MSAVLPVYNGASFLEAAVASVYAQTVLPDEVIVVNDGSTDGTESILRRLESELPPTFRWITQANGGEPSARNVGVALARSEFVAFLDHDDVWRPAKIARQLEEFAREPSLSLSFTAHKQMSRGATEVIEQEEWDPDPGAVLEKLMRSPRVGPPSTVLVRRHALDRVPRFDETLRLGCDWLMWLNIAAAGMRIGYLDEPLVEYHWHGDNLSDDEFLYYESACEVFDRFFVTDGLGHPRRGNGRKWRARWRLLSAIHAIQNGDKRRARRYIIAAARTNPIAVRPGWARMLGIGTPPS